MHLPQIEAKDGRNEKKYRSNDRRTDEGGQERDAYERDRCDYVRNVPRGIGVIDPRFNTPDKNFSGDRARVELFPGNGSCPQG